MPSRSNIPASGGVRVNNAAAGSHDNIKDEEDEDDGPIPFLVAGGGGAPDGGGDCGRTVHSVSPTNATPCKREEEDLAANVNGTSDAIANKSSEKGGVRQPDVMRSNSNDNNEKEKDILLSLKDEKYKKNYSHYCEKLWGEKRDESLTVRDLGEKMLHKLKRRVKRSGGNLYRGSKGGNSTSPASDEVALKSEYCFFLYHYLHLMYHFKIHIFCPFYSLFCTRNNG